MYGWIHECLKYMIISRYGQEIWNKIINKLNLNKDYWDIKEYVSDNIFFQLNSIAAEVIGINETQVIFILNSFPSFYFLYFSFTFLTFSILLSNLLTY